MYTDFKKIGLIPWPKDAPDYADVMMKTSSGCKYEFLGLGWAKYLAFDEFYFNHLSIVSLSPQLQHEIEKCKAERGNYLSSAINFPEKDISASPSFALGGGIRPMPSFSVRHVAGNGSSYILSRIFSDLYDVKLRIIDSTSSWIGSISPMKDDFVAYDLSEEGFGLNPFSLFLTEREFDQEAELILTEFFLSILDLRNNEFVPFHELQALIKRAWQREGANSSIYTILDEALNQNDSDSFAIVSEAINDFLLHQHPKTIELLTTPLSIELYPMRIFYDLSMLDKDMDDSVVVCLLSLVTFFESRISSLQSLLYFEDGILNDAVNSERMDSFLACIYKSAKKRGLCIGVSIHKNSEMLFSRSKVMYMGEQSLYCGVFKDRNGITIPCKELGVKHDPNRVVFVRLCGVSGDEKFSIGVDEA